MKFRFWREDTIFNILLAIIIIGTILRIFGLPGSLHFAGDEGRDLFIIQEIASGEEFPTLGPSASTGGFFLGPAFYYIVSLPSLFTAHPLAPALVVIAFGIATIWLLYITGRRMQSPALGLIAAALFSTSFLGVMYTRWSWNPNLLPFFVTLIILCVYESRREPSTREGWWRGRGKYIVFLGPALGIALQLHATAFLLVPALVVFWIIWRPRVKNIWSWVAGAVLFVLTMLPWLAYEFTHNFSNTRGAWEILGSSNGLNLAERFHYLAATGINVVNSLFFGDLLPAWAIEVFVVAVAAAFLWRLFFAKSKLDKTGNFILIILILALVFYTLYTGILWPHYFLIIVPSLVLIVGLALLGKWQDKLYFKIFIVALVLLMSYCGIYTTVSHFLAVGAKDASGPFSVSLQDEEEVVREIGKYTGDKIDLEFCTSDNFEEAFRYLLLEDGIEIDDEARFKAIVFRPVESPDLAEFNLENSDIRYQRNQGNLGLIIISK